MDCFDFSHLDGDPVQISFLLICGIIVGMSKTGIQGIMTLAIPAMALVFGGKESTGVILPMLCFADLLAVIYYRRQAEWKYILKLLPTAIAGFLVMFRTRKNTMEENQKIFSKWWCAAIFGILGGFTTMIGNAAGPIMAVYLLSMRLPKYAFVGTSAWFFLIVNYLKIPLQIFAWNNITPQTLALNIIAIPSIFLGAFLGVLFVKHLPEKSYRGFIIFMTIVSTLLLLF